MKKNDVITLEIDDLTVDGYGVGRHEGLAVFVPRALPGECVEALVIKRVANHAAARLQRILTASPHRTEPSCPRFGRCGGCTLQHLTYEKQLAYKTGHVKNCLKRIAGLDVPVADCQPSPRTLAYRNKSAIPVVGANGGFCTGFYATRSHRVTDMESCAIQEDGANRALRALRLFLGQYDVPAYDENSHRGLVRHMVVRCAGNGGVMVALVINGESMPHEREWVALLKKEVPSLACAMLSFNTEKTNVIWGSRQRVLYGEDGMEEHCLDLSFRVSLKSFLQVNREQAEKLYVKALEYAGLGPQDIVLDLFCGIGTLTLAAARLCRMAYGAEIAPEAVADANENKQRNGICNAKFFCADAGDALAQLLRSEKRIDMVFLDPPRKGCEKSVLETLMRAAPARIVYVSCDPATLARDLKILAREYRAVEAVPFDMFPHTTHVETVVLMSRVKE